MKRKQNSLIYALVLTTAFSGVVSGPAGLLGTNVAFAANGSATSNLPSSLTRLLMRGSRGEDVKLLQTILNKEGFNLEVDGSFGPLTLKAVKEYQRKNGLKVDGFVGPETRASLMSKMAEKPAEPTKPTEPTKPVASGKTVLKVGRADHAAHGTKAFANAAVVLAGDKIVAVSLDEYQFMNKASNVGVPNSDQDFGKNYGNPDMVLGSKLTNATTYSANMASRGGSTVSIDENFKAIEEFAKGKTIAELEEILAKTPYEKVVDVVSSATLVDTAGYIQTIINAAKKTKANEAFVVDNSSLDHLTIARADSAPHGTKSFASVVTVLNGDQIVAASIEEYQFMAKASNTPVPNSDKDFGSYYADPDMALASKLTNAATYSANMASRGGSTVSIDQNFSAIEAYAAGKTIAELEEILNKTSVEDMVDVVSSATLVDTHHYLKSILDTAKSASVTLKVGRADHAAHGTKAFANAAVVLAGDKIVAVSLDEYQFMNKASNIGVPNSDQDFGKNYGNPDMVLGSKLTNAATYSENMASRGGSTVSIDQNFKAIEEFAKGKTVAELEEILASNPYEKVVDVVSSATLVDTAGYIQTIINAAKNAKANEAFVVKASSLDNLKISRTDSAPHGTKSFASVVTVLDGNKIVAASIEEYQFMAKASNTPVPNSDKDFGSYYADPDMVLASKLTNAATYSANMASRGGSTISIDENFSAIEAYAAGKTIAELEELLNKNTVEGMVDVVSSATLVDTHHYLNSILNTAKLAK